MGRLIQSTGNLGHPRLALQVQCMTLSEALECYEVHEKSHFRIGASDLGLHFCPTCPFACMCSVPFGCCCMSSVCSTVVNASCMRWPDYNIKAPFVK